jgi:hypothetical protein
MRDAWAAIGLSSIHGEIHFKYVDSWFPQESPRAVLSVLSHDLPHFVGGPAPKSSHAGDLKFRCRGTDVRIETAGRGGHQVDRWGCNRTASLTERLDTGLRSSLQRRMQWPVV